MNTYRYPGKEKAKFCTTGPSRWMQKRQGRHRKSKMNNLFLVSTGVCMKSNNVNYAINLYFCCAVSFVFLNKRETNSECTVTDTLLDCLFVLINGTLVELVSNDNIFYLPTQLIESSASCNFCKNSPSSRSRAFFFHVI